MVEAFFFAMMIASAAVVFCGFRAGGAERGKSLLICCISGFVWALLAAVTVFCMKPAVRTMVGCRLVPHGPLPVEVKDIAIPDIVMIHLGVIVFLAGIILFLWSFNCRRNVSKWYWALLWCAGIVCLSEYILFLPLFYGIAAWMNFLPFQRDDFYNHVPVFLFSFYVMLAIFFVTALLWSWHTWKSSVRSWKNILNFIGCFTGLTAVLWGAAWCAGLRAEEATARKADELKIQAFRTVADLSPVQKKWREETERFHAEHPKYLPPRSGIYNWANGNVPADVREYTLKMFDSPEMNAHLELLGKSAALLARKDVVYLSSLQDFRALVRHSADKAELYLRSGQPEKSAAELMRYPEMDALIPADTPFLIHELVRTAARSIWAGALVQYGPDERQYLSDYRKLLEWSGSWRVHLPCEAGGYLAEPPSKGNVLAEFFYAPYLNTARYRGFFSAVSKIPALEKLQRQEVISGNGMFARAARRQRLGIALGRTAIALKLYRVEHGKYPEKLSELSPRFLEKEYYSPATGKAFSYTVKNGEFTLSSDGVTITSQRRKKESPARQSFF